MNSIRYPQESASPVRKKGRNKHSVRELNSSSKPDTANPFLFSQDSMVASQFSQNFADRMGQLHMFNSQDNSNISSSESNYSVPFMQQSGSANVTTENTYLNSRPTVAPQASSSSYSKQPAAAAFETERPIDIPPPLKNVFLTGTRPHNELYFDPTSSCGDDVAASKKVKRPTKVWIGAFQERPRIITEFEELRLLGEGTFSTVSCVRHRLDGTLYAVKRVKEAISSERQAHTLLREVSALSVLQGCPQIVRYHTSWIDNHHLFIQTELCHLGSLEDLVSPAPSHSSVIYSASVAKRSILSGGNLPPALKAEISADRNRSESFNSIDITDASLLQDECLTAPGPVNHISFMPPPPPAPAAVSAVEGAAATASVSAGASANSSVLMKGGSVGNNTSGASDFVYFTQTQQSQSNQMMTTDEDSGNAASTVRGVSEDLAWLILYDVSCALKYMHDRGIS